MPRAKARRNCWHNALSLMVMCLACGSPSQQTAARMRKVTLNQSPGEPIGLAVLPDGRVLHTTRRGQIWMHDPSSGSNSLAAQIPVYQHDEEGLQGIAIDSQFSENGWVYVYYSPPLDTPLDIPETADVNEGDAPLDGVPGDWAAFAGHLQLSRFELQGDTLSLSTEQQILRVPVDRGICCHVGGDIDFDAEGNLYLSTGDDSNPFESDGYAPIDERLTSHPALDAQRSAANTDDLRGKILRIHVESDGSYTIPEGNLFAVALSTESSDRSDNRRPEIFAMGLRNPFRFAVNRRRNEIYVADYAPDATRTTAARGPRAEGRWMTLSEPANLGWPYCMRSEAAYTDYDFDTGISGEPFNCQALVNESPNNTGARELPALTPVEFWYGFGGIDQFPQLGVGGVGPMAGPAYHYDSQLDSPVKWPEQWDEATLFYEWTRDAIHVLTLNSRSRAVDSMSEVRLDLPVDNPIDMEFGPDGALYVLEYGDGYFGENPDAQLARFEYFRP